MSNLVHSTIIPLAQLLQPVDLVEGDAKTLTGRKFNSAPVKESLVLKGQGTRLGVNKVGILAEG